MAYSHKLLRDHVFDSLRGWILSGKLAPGQRIVELELAQHFKTSQGPVREALQRLATEGLVDLKRYRGTYVASLNDHEMRGICDVRKAVESVAAREAVAVITSEQLDCVYTMIAEIHAAADQNNFSQMVEKDIAFHRYVCECSGQQTLSRVWNILAVQIERFLTISHPKYFPDLHETAAAHRPLVRALEDRDPDRAARAFEEHIDLIWSRIDREANAESSGE